MLTRQEGFVDQRLCVVPEPQVVVALGQPVTRRLTVTDAGYFPRAAGHLRRRREGATETIVILCTAGRGTVALGQQTVVLTPGACATIPAGVPHTYAASVEAPWSIWWIHVRGTDVEELTGPLLGAQRPVARLRATDRVVALFDDAVTTLEHRPSPAQLLDASSTAWHLLTRIAVDCISPADGSALERAMRFLEARVEGNVSVTDLATMVSVSPSHLSSLFRKATGGGPGAFHTSLKMARARSLLDTTDLSVRDVASSVGYADPLYFSRHFRRVHGVSPSTYRQQRKG